MELEERIAGFKNVEACVVFQSGFAANAGTVSAILGPEDHIISDELNHASIIDGCRLSRAKIHVFPHKDVAAAEKILAELARRSRPQAADHRRRLLHGWRYRPAARPGRSRRTARRHHDGGRRALLRRAGPQRPRHHRPLRPARPRAHPGGDAFESHRRARRLRLRQPRPDRVPLPPRAPVPVFHLASAGRGRGLPGRLRRPRSRSRSASSSCGTTPATSSRD